MGNKEQLLNIGTLTAFPQKPSLAKAHYYHPKPGAKQIVSQQHNPEGKRAKKQKEKKKQNGKERKKEKELKVLLPLDVL